MIVLLDSWKVRKLSAIGSMKTSKDTLSWFRSIIDGSAYVKFRPFDDLVLLLESTVCPSRVIAWFSMTSVKIGALLDVKFRLGEVSSSFKGYRKRLDLHDNWKFGDERY